MSNYRYGTQPANRDSKELRNPIILMLMQLLLSTMSMIPRLLMKSKHCGSTKSKTIAEIKLKFMSYAINVIRMHKL